jgi:hypothetical protein
MNLVTVIASALLLMSSTFEAYSPTNKYTEFLKSNFKSPQLSYNPIPSVSRNFSMIFNVIRTI